MRQPAKCDIVALDKGVTHNSYDNTPPVDAYGREVQYDAQNHLTGSAASREREEKRRQKQERVRAVRKAYSEGMTKAGISREMHLSPGAVTRYVGMSEEEVEALVLPKRRQAASRAGRYRNIVFKMMRDGWDDRTIFWYLRSAGIDDPADYMYSDEGYQCKQFPGSSADAYQPHHGIVCTERSCKCRTYQSQADWSLSVYIGQKPRTSPCV